jgi:hypothetical protein
MIKLLYSHGDPKKLTPDTNSDKTKNHYNESALSSAAHILICLTHGKSNEEIAGDFGNNLEFVSVWIDYMIGIKWLYKNTDGKWITTDDGKIWMEKCYNTN